MMRKNFALFVAAVLLASPAFAGNSSAGAGAGAGHSAGSSGGAHGGAVVGAHSGHASAAIAHIHARGAGHGMKHLDKIGSGQRKTAPYQVNMHRLNTCSPLARETRDLAYCSAPAKLALDDKADTLVR